MPAVGVGGGCGVEWNQPAYIHHMPNSQEMLAKDQGQLPTGLNAQTSSWWTAMTFHGEAWSFELLSLASACLCLVTHPQCSPRLWEFRKTQLKHKELEKKTRN